MISSHCNWIFVVVQFWSNSKLRVDTFGCGIITQNIFHFWNTFTVQSSDDNHSFCIPFYKNDFINIRSLGFCWKTRFFLYKHQVNLASSLIILQIFPSLLLEICSCPRKFLLSICLSFLFYNKTVYCIIIYYVLHFTLLFSIGSWKWIFPTKRRTERILLSN